jgi:hypothetical protein
VSVEITVNWTFIGESDDDIAHLTFGTHHIGDRDGEEDAQRDADETDDVFTAVVPLGSSVLAPGLSLPLPI